MTPVAALYVDVKRGPYPALPGVDCWGIERDARLYDGPGPVVAHPACGPWGQLRAFNRHQDPGDGPRGVEQVLAFGGVLEHPAGSLLWAHCGLPRPGEFPQTREGRTVLSIEVDQVRWGHEARKRTWLLLVDVDPSSVGPMPPDRDPTRTVQSRVHAHHGRADRMPEMSTRRRHLTPPAFAEWLVTMARSAARAKVAA